MGIMTRRKCLKYIFACAFILLVFMLIPGNLPPPNIDSTIATLIKTDPKASPIPILRTEPREAIIQKRFQDNVGVNETLHPKAHQKDTKPISNMSQQLEQKSKLLPNSSEEATANFNASLKFVIDDMNKRQELHNHDKFPPTPNGTYEFVLVVQTHNRDHYLTYLIQSLKKVRNIERALLIVSHDYYSAPVFTAVKSIDFMPWMQIFYPYAMQLYSNRYPGPDPQDCPRNVKKPEALKLGCVNAEHPDLYGHYREAAYSQTKLHWFWKLHRVFDELDIMRNYTGVLTLLEEDHYVTPDMLYMLELMILSKPRLCPDCCILTLGNYDKKPSYSYSEQVVIANDFISSKHNMAMSFNRTIYKLIKSHSKEFCAYDDYNWDWTIQYLGKSVLTPHFKTMILKTPRVHHIGECGVHFKGKKCNPEAKAKPIEDLVSKGQDKLYPSELQPGKATSATNIVSKKMKPNGGWGDTRDHQLCIELMKDT